MNFYTMTSKETTEYISRLPIDTKAANSIEEGKQKSLIARFFGQFSDFMTIILLIASAISFWVATVSDSGDYLDPIIILAIVVLNAILGVIEESKADKAIKSLKKLSSPTANILRNGTEMTIPAEKIRVGDTLLLTTGCRVCADARLLTDNSLETDESALTGESMSAEKDSRVVLEDYTPLAEQKNMVFSGTNVVHGNGKAIVTAIGMNTEMGKIAALLTDTEEEPTPLQRKLAETGKILGISAILICAVVFLMGIVKKMPPLEMFLTSVSLAVAAIPEGLPIIATIVLAIGVQRMAKHKAIVKNLPAVETLGGATVICSDKTGTLTENNMKVSKIFADDTLQLAELGALCCNNDKNPTENALISFAEENKLIKKNLDEKCPRITEIPFDSTRKMMSVLVKYYGSNRVISKGAVEILIKHCTHVVENGKAVELTPEKCNNILAKSGEMSNNALRVIAVAYKDTLFSHISEQGLILAGIVGIYDPPRKEAKDAVLQCLSAGIKPVMITGDNKLTAISIAKAVGIEGKAITGEEMSKIPDEALTDYSIFARVTPSDKVRIVKAYKKAGHIVAMTGDGVNDAPALKNADIGCSMGKNGTDVAKEASDLILADDNFATIVSAVREGRGIFDNIKKSVKFLLSSNIGEILSVFVGMLMSWEAPLCATQLLWVNLITDSLPALSLGVDPADSDIMQKKPRNPKEGIFSKGMWLSIALEGCMIGLLCVVAYCIGRIINGSTPYVPRTMAFSVLALSQLFHAFNMRSDGSVLGKRFFENKFLILSLLAGIALQLCVVNIPPLAEVFKTTPLSVKEWSVVIGLSIMPLTIVEIQKLFSLIQSRRK
ncbi:MAG: calcium-translocating P-type ATPase, PMCA-type [Ruminococcaceae bacterium]|nr:calcium-translocating P-type ATPase, PMCA-type [Oscillospiraceae bacterium]